MVHAPQEEWHMQSLDTLRERFAALERRTEHLQQQTHALEVQTRTVERRLRWWRGLACGVMVLGLLSGALPSGKTVDAQQEGLPARVAVLEDKLVAVTFNSAGHELVITGVNLRIVNGLGATETTNGLGNMILRYNESRGLDQDTRTGSHNVVVGEFHNFSSFGGLVVGQSNEISGEFASIGGGQGNTASGEFASVSGGNANTASGGASSVSGGFRNTASGASSSVSGGQQHTVVGRFSWAAGEFASGN